MMFSSLRSLKGMGWSNDGWEIIFSYGAWKAVPSCDLLHLWEQQGA